MTRSPDITPVTAFVAAVTSNVEQVILGKRGQIEYLLVVLLQDEGHELPWGSTIVAITGSANREVSQALLRLKRQGHAVALIVVSQELPAHLPSGIAVHQVWADGDLVAGLAA